MSDALTCLHGTPWRDHVLPLFSCAGCAQSVRRAVAHCDVEIAAGRLDADLYTPAERRQKAKRNAISHL